MKNRAIFWVLMVFGFFTGRIFADGMFVWNRGADLNEPSQKAIIHWANDIQTMILQVKYEGKASDFGWIVPLPSKPQVSAIEADESPFGEISHYTQVRRRWGSRSMGEDDWGVKVLERKKVGVYDIAVLSSGDSGELARWLKKNGYVFPAGRKDILDHYTKKKWVYAAIKINPGELANDEVKKLNTGELQPVRFRFASKEMVYPLKISSGNSGKTQVLLYLLSERPVVARSAEGSKRFRIEENFPRMATSIYAESTYVDYENGTYRKVTLPLTWKALGIDKQTSLSLCKYRSVYTSKEMVDDVVFENFDAISYWKKRFSLKAPKHDYTKERERQKAFEVLAWHDISIIEDFARDEDSRNREFAAKHPKTPEKLLLELANDKERMIRYDLARNRNTPRTVLLKLAEDEYDRIRVLVARHPNTTLDMLKKFITDESVEVREALVYNKITTKEMLVQLSKDKEMKIRRSVAHKKNLPIEVLTRLARDESSEVRAGVAKNSNLPAYLQEELLQDSSRDVWRMASTHGNNLSVKTLVKMANETRAWMRLGAARNVKTPVNELRKLAGDKESMVRQYLALNAQLPKDILDILANDEQTDVKVCLAHNKSCPAEFLKKLSKDENADVRGAVAGNENTPEAVLRVLAKDPGRKVAHLALMTLAKLKK